MIMKHNKKILVSFDKEEYDLLKDMKVRFGMSMTNTIKKCLTTNTTIYEMIYDFEHWIEGSEEETKNKINKIQKYLS